jgi:O-antigen/teichoic acid export membrane protein
LESAHTRKRIAASTIWALIGSLVPMLVGLLAVPWFLHRLGQERFGVLSLIWVVVGYFSFLDMGLGRAVTVAVAPFRRPDVRAAASGGADPEGLRNERDILGAASTLIGGIGLGVTALLAIGLAAGGLPIHLSAPELHSEAERAIWVMLPAIPLLLLSSILRGHLEGVGAFRSLNVLRTLAGVLLFGAPMLAALFSPSLVWSSLAILLVRAANLALLAVLVSREMQLPLPALARTLLTGAHRVWLRRLWSFGSWATVSNVVGPIIVYIDRFVIAVVLSAAAVAAYTVPFDVVSRLPVIIAALCSVLLPEFARHAPQPQGPPGTGNPAAARRIVRVSTLASAALVLVVVVLGGMLAPAALTLWLGSAFSGQSAGVTQVLLLAFGINAMAQIPFTALQGSGHARAVAVVHLLEILPYLGLVIWAVGAHGLLGAAWAWTLRGLVDYVALLWLWRKLGAG